MHCVTKVLSSDPQEDNRHQTTCCSRSEVQEQLSFKVVDSIWFFKIKRDDDLVWFLDFEIGGNVVIRDFLRRKLWTRGLDGKFMVLWRVMASSHRARKRQKCAIFNSLPNQNEKVSQSSLSSLSVSLSLYLALLTGRGIFSSLKSIPLRIGSSLLIQKTLPTVTFSQL